MEGRAPLGRRKAAILIGGDRALMGTGPYIHQQRRPSLLSLLPASALTFPNATQTFTKTPASTLTFTNAGVHPILPRRRRRPAYLHHRWHRLSPALTPAPPATFTYAGVRPDLHERQRPPLPSLTPASTQTSTNAGGDPYPFTNDGAQPYFH